MVDGKKYSELPERTKKIGTLIDSSGLDIIAMLSFLICVGLTCIIFAIDQFVLSANNHCIHLRK